MREIRKNLVTGEFVIIAPGRARRRSDYADRPPAAPRPPRRDDCPFCPGNEAATTGVTWSHPEGEWRVRSFPNKFSLLAADGEPWRRTEGLRTSAAAVGPHEVICEARGHDQALGRIADAEVADVVRCWHHRFSAFYQDPRVAFVSLFKNHGVRAGSSLEHTHSQVVGIPMVPEQVRRRAADAERYQEVTGLCLQCRMLEDELQSERVVHQSGRFVCFVPWAALSPYHLWIYPRRHAGSFSAATPEELADLGGHLRAVLGRVERALGDPDYNLVIQSGHAAQATSPFLHWYLSVVPRVTNQAGLELGTAMYVNSSLPEDSAALLRSAD